VDQAAGSHGALFHRWRKHDHQLGMDHRRVPADCLPDKLATSDKKPVAVFHILTTRTPPRPSYTTSVDSTAGLRRPLLPLTALLPLRAPPPMSARVSTRSSDVSPGCPRPWPVAAPTEKDLWLARADWMKHRSDQARVAGSVNGGHPPSAIRHSSLGGVGVLECPPMAGINRVARVQLYQDALQRNYCRSRSSTLACRLATLSCSSTSSR